MSLYGGFILKCKGTVLIQSREGSICEYFCAWGKVVKRSQSLLHPTQVADGAERDGAAAQPTLCVAAQPTVRSRLH